MQNSGKKKFISQEKLNQKFNVYPVVCKLNLYMLNTMSINEIDIKFNIMLDSSVSRDTRHKGQVTHSLDVLHIALIISCMNSHFCMWMLLQLSLCE